MSLHQSRPLTVSWYESAPEFFEATTESFTLYVHRPDAAGFDADLDGDGPWLAEVTEGPEFANDGWYAEQVWSCRFGSAEAAKRWACDMAANEALRVVVGMGWG